MQYSPANHGLGYGRFDLRRFVPSDDVDGAERPRLAREFRFEMPLREHLAQKVTFFESLADGVLDADELAQGTDPYDPESH